MPKKKTLTKNEIIYEILDHLRECSVEQLGMMYRVLDMAAEAALEISEASKKTGLEVGVKVNLFGREKGKGKDEPEYPVQKLN